MDGIQISSLTGIRPGSENSLAEIIDIKTEVQQKMLGANHESSSVVLLNPKPFVDCKSTAGIHSYFLQIFNY